MQLPGLEFGTLRAGKQGAKLPGSSHLNTTPMELPIPIAGVVGTAHTLQDLSCSSSGDPWERFTDGKQGKGEQDAILGQEQSRIW